VCQKSCVNYNSSSSYILYVQDATWSSCWVEYKISWTAVETNQEPKCMIKCFAAVETN
jgi:hypothetical protein